MSITTRVSATTFAGVSASSRAVLGDRGAAELQAEKLLLACGQSRAQRGRQGIGVEGGGRGGSDAFAGEQSVEPLGDHARRGRLEHDARGPGRQGRFRREVVALVENGHDTCSPIGCSLADGDGERVRGEAGGVQHDRRPGRQGARRGQLGAFLERQVLAQRGDQLAEHAAEQGPFRDQHHACVRSLPVRHSTRPAATSAAASPVAATTPSTTGRP